MIKFDKEKQIFKLDTRTSSYIFQVYRENYLVHLYYGAKIPDDNVTQFMDKGGFVSISPENENLIGVNFSPDVTPMEYACNGTGDYRISALSIKNADGNTATDIRYTGHKIYKGKPDIQGLPSLYAGEDDAETLEVCTFDQVTGAKVTLIYTVFNKYSAMTKTVRVENTSERPFSIENIASCCTELPSMDYTMHHLYGSWCRERHIAKHPLEHGIQSIKSKRGSSSHNHNPFVALSSFGANEDFGDVYGFNLVYSGNFSIDIEVDSYNTSRLVMGINPEDFSWKLSPGETFCAPEAVMVYSGNGLGEMSRTFHDLYTCHLLRGPWKNKKRPLLINSWEGVFFDFDDEKIYSFAKHAKELGIELLVMDDGWFGKRNSDNCSLGDWYVNTDKLKGGLSNLIQRINALGIKFGIWYEPEMISPDSDLFRAHPDWALQVPGRAMSVGRRQYVLDMTRQDVRDNIFAQMCEVLENNNIEYVKWDYNRAITEAGSALLPADRQGEVFHRYILGTYELMDRFVKKFPHILFESCAGGGGRFDPGIFAYSRQAWCSDNTDPIDRLAIQFGTSMCYPVSVVGAHVSANARTGLETKANVAMAGTFGYELDPDKLSEEEKEIIRKQVADYHKYYELIHSGDLYRLVYPDDNSYYCSWSYVSKDKSEVLYTLVIMRKPALNYMIAKLKGLDPDKYYKEESTGEIYSGALLMHAGINISQRWHDGKSIRLHLTEVQQNI